MLRMHLALALKLGFHSREELYENIRAVDLAEIEECYAIDPWGEERADLRNGILCSLIDACNRVKGHAEPPAHYMPYSEVGRPKQQSLESMKATWKLAVAGFNNPKGC